ncbi:3-oxoacyl-[acyl-carrier-protein] reductase [soil metagenome]
MNFQGKNVLVTGGARGIGRAVAQAFAAQGARVALSYRNNHAAAEETLASLHGDGHLKLAGDITEPDFTQELVARTVAGLGSLDILVNNAGIFEAHPIDSASFDAWQSAWRRTLNVNLVAPANLCYHAAQMMIQQGGGKIVNVSSRGAFRGEPESPAYGASKAALNAMIQSLAQKLAPHNISVGVVAPGFVETDMAWDLLKSPRGEEVRNQSPFGRVAKPEEVAHAVLFLASEEAVFSSGAIIDVNGASYLRS